MKRITFYTTVFIFFLSFTILSAGNYSFDFLELGVGTRAKALGGSFVSVADDGSSILWNPAGTSRISSSRFYFMHNSNFAGMSNIDYISFIKPIVARSFFSIALIRHSVNDIPIFPELEGTPEERDTTPAMQGDGNPMGFFGEKANIYFINLSKLFEIKNLNFSLGGNFKYFDETFRVFDADYGGTGIGVDIGGIITLKTKKIPGRLTIGLNLQDATGTQILWNTTSQKKDIIPTNYRFGLNYRKEVEKIESSFLLTFDYNTRYDGSQHTGLEYSYKENFLVDIGWNKGRWSFGTGFKFWKIGIQYGFISHTLGPSHSVSMEFIL
ncbi:MAG: hypothetical protein E3J87_09650 [Candidatus Cloacimonadota bacterium]|nr:MAG: hypothetical protein E3J87_09650 [Candidatus Cloacimonadota bacterium]